ncbi:sporulation protein YunB [Cohnella mopanensis]|uniref:sporulation protein YunB n=1 Tax=Cohnella mopanensis TaxID=2911966 RepID=UPI001EF98435|nr:sporulation protein YunB [Cohnella mopanensis]
MSMRRKWGNGFSWAFMRNLSLPKRAPRKWGGRSVSLRGGVIPKPKPRKWGGGFTSSYGGTPSRPQPRKWGTRKWFSTSRRGSGYTPAKKFAPPKRPQRRLKRKHFWLIMALLMTFILVQGTIFLDRELRQPLMFLAKIRVHQLATEAINTAIKEEIAQTADSDQMIRWKTNVEGKITGFEIDYKQQMAITAKTIDVVNRVLKEHEDVPERIPVGHALNSPFISSIGPSVSVRFHPASVLKVDVETESRDAGINMLLVEVYVRIRTEISVVIPFDKEPETLETKIPLSYALVVGDVPTYYYDNNGNPVGNGAAQAPSIALPTPNNALGESVPQEEH